MKDKPCKTCPFKPENHGKPNPNGFEPSDDNPDYYEYDWYSEENLRRIVDDGLRGEGANFICHRTDPDAQRYGGWPAKDGVKRQCVGYEAMLQKHIRVLNEAGGYDEYIELCKKMDGEWWSEFELMRNAIRMTPSGYEIPDPDLSVEMGVSWDDGVLNATFDEE